MTKLVFGLLVAAALIVPLGIAQTPPDIAADARKANVPDPVIAPFCVGTAFNATLVTPLDASRNKAGDPVSAETSEAVTYERTVIFPKGTKIYGHLVRASSSRSGKGSALFVQFDKAILKNGQQVMMNAGIQALVAGRAPVSGDATTPAGVGVPHPSFAPSDDYTPRDVSNPAVVPASQKTGPTSGSSSQGSVTRQGMLTPDSQGALGSSDLKVYTPLSEGSDGTVLLSGKNVRLDAGTKLLLVIQPPPESDPSLQ